MSIGIKAIYIYLNSDGLLLNVGRFCSRKDAVYRLATDAEKQQLFDALSKEGKRWNPDTKQIENLPKKYKPKPMDWCLIQAFHNDIWFLAQYACRIKNRIYFAGGMNVNIQEGLIIIPYNDQTKHLLGTTDDWKGGGG